MTFGQFITLYPDMKVSGAGDYLVRMCGKAVRFASLEVARAEKLKVCGPTCRGNHEGIILEQYRKPRGFAAWVASE